MSILPHSAEAERAILGAMCRNESATLFVFEHLRTNDFFIHVNREIFAAMAAVDASGKPVDEVTVITHLENSGALKNAGGVSYITELRDTLPSIVNLPYYVGIVKEKAKRREVIAFSEALKKSAFESETLSELIPRAIDELCNIGSEAETKSMIRLDDALAQSYFNLAAEEGTEQRKQSEIMKPGFRDLELYVPRFKPGQLIILAARPSVGKSTLALNIGVNIAKKGGVVAMFSLEMDAIEELAPKVFVSEGRTTTGNIERGSEWQKLLLVQERMKDAEFWIDDTPGVTVPYIRSRLKRLMSRTKRLDFVIIDYLQLLKPVKGTRNATKNDEVAEISKSLKTLARELKVPIMTLSQLNRDVEKRSEKPGGRSKPQLSDLRDSGAIEQDADIVMMLDRPKQSYAEPTEIGVLKHRNGGTGGVTLWFNAPQSRFETYEDE